MRFDYKFPEELGIEKLVLTDNMFNHLGFHLGTDETEEEWESPDLTEIELLRLIDIWLEFTKMPASGFILLCSYYEDGGSQNSHGYSYSKEVIDSEMEEYLRQCLDKSIFAKQMNFASEKEDVSIDVGCDYNQYGYERLVVDLFRQLDTLYRNVKSFETTHWIYEE